MQPSFCRHDPTATAKVADVRQDDRLQVSADLTKRTVSMSAVLLGLGSWPIAILAVLLLLTALFVVVLMVLFRGREMSDMP